MSAPPTDAPTEAIPPPRHAERTFLPRMIRTLALPIILGWILVIVVFNTVVPQLEEVGKIFSVTRERVRQIENKALRSLQHPSRSRRLAAFVERPIAAPLTYVDDDVRTLENV